MKMPSANKTGLAKAATILATILLISLGLCGANFFAVIRFVPMSDPPPGYPTWPERLLTITAKIEIAAICLSIFGLILVGIQRITPTLRITPDERREGASALDRKDSDSKKASTVPNDQPEEK